MRKSIALAAAMTVSAGASAVGALTVPNPYYGSDTLEIVTANAITNAGLSSASNYIPAGSGAGQSAMLGSTVAAAHQQTAPMSKAMTNGVCNKFGGTNGSAMTNANGMVIGMDAVDIYSAVTAGGSSSCNGTADATGTGLAYSGVPTGVFAGGNSGQNWKWALALLYGGLDLSSSSTLADCNSSARQALVSNWSNMFQDASACSTELSSNATVAGVCGDGNHNNVLWHAFRRDDASGTSDVFSSLIGINTQFPATSFSGNNGFGASPYCNAMNWDTNTSNNGGTFCNLGKDDQFVGPGGITDPNSQCKFLGFQSSNVGTAEVCTGGGNHKMPPPGTWGNAPLATSGASNWDVLPTSFQDNDPVRRPCLGGLTGHPFTAGEEVCNLDGKLGVVVAIPASDFIISSTESPAGMVQFPTPACNGAFIIGKAPNVFNCAPWAFNSTTGQPSYHNGECPNGDGLVGGGCETPIVKNVTSQCLATKATIAPLHSRNIGAPDGRAFNLAMRDGDISDGSCLFVKETVQNGTTIPPIVDFFAGMGRIHTVATVWNDGNETGDTSLALTNPPNVGCQMSDATDQIACLLQADPCSIGYAGDGGKTWTQRIPSSVCANLTTAGVSPLPPACSSSSGLVSDSMRIDQIYPTATTVTALGSQNTEYQIGRKLYFNSTVGFANLTAGTSGVTDTATGELTLAQYEAVASNINPILTNVGYFPLTTEPFSSTTFPWASAPFCEDFNETLVCNPTGSSASTLPNNVNACANNGTVSLPTAGSICGNGTQEPFEECDDGLNNGTTGDKCSTTCRCAGTKSYENTGSGFSCQ